MNYLLGIDIGTSGVKALLISETGKIAASASSPLKLSTPAPGWAEQDPRDWLRAAHTAAAKATAAAGAAKSRKIAAVSFSGQMHGLTPLDKKLQPIRPAILWCDQRTSAERAQIEKTIGLKKLLRTTCNPPLEGFTAPKILWLKNNEPQNFRRMAAFALPKDFVRLHFTGQLFTDTSDAAGTALLDVPRARWAWNIIDALGLPRSIFPEAIPSTAIAGRITAQTARITGIPEGTPVAAGGADNACAAAGTGILNPGDAGSSIGSSGVVVTYAGAPRIDPLARVHTFNHSAPGSWYNMGVSLTAGLSFRWLRDTLGGAVDYPQLTKLAASSPPGAAGLTFLPYLSGERTPHKNPNARGVLFGISLGTEPRHIARAVMEGITFALKDSLDIIAPLSGAKKLTVRATGGGAKSPLWLQMQADIFGCDILTLNHDEGPALGAALIAATAAGIFPTLQQAAAATVKPKTLISPNKTRHAEYTTAHNKFKSLYKSLEKEFQP